MPRISLGDAAGLEVDLELREDGAWGRYLEDLEALSFRDEVQHLFDLPVRDLPDDVSRLDLGLDVEQPLRIEAGDGAGLELTAGVVGSMRIVESGDPLLATDPFGDPLRAGAGERWAGLSLSVKVGLGHPGGGPLPFGVEAGRRIVFTTWAEIEDDATFAEAVHVAFDAFAIPADATDLRGLPPPGIVTVEGTGRLSLAARTDLVAVSNPLAGAALPTPAPDVELAAGGSIRVDADLEISGEYRVRVHRRQRGALVSVHRRNGRAFGVGVRLAAGLAARLGDLELAEKVLGAFGGDSDAAREARRAELQAAGLDGEQRRAIDVAIKESLERTLELAVRFEYGASASQGAALELEVDLEELGAPAEAVVEQVLRGDLSAVTTAEDEVPAGIVVRRSLVRELRRHEHPLRANLLGIFDFGSVVRLALEGRVLHDAETGELVIADEATAERISSGFGSFRADPGKLRSVLAEFFLLTAVYRGTRELAGPPELRSAHTYFRLDSDTDAGTMRDYLEVVEALGLLMGNRADDLLRHRQEFGRSTLRATTEYDHQAARALFLDDDGRPRRREEYEGLGRRAILLLVRGDDPGAGLRRRIGSDPDWERMKEAGQAQFEMLFPGARSLEVGLLRGDYSAIVWWAEAMEEAAEALQEIEALHAGHGGPAPAPDSPEFAGRRRELAERLAEVASRAHKRFSEPWGLVAMDLACGRRAHADARIDSADLCLKARRNPPELLF